MTEPLAVARSSTENTGDLGGQARGLILAGFLAALAGMVDAIGYLRLGHLFVSFMSGNSTQLAVAVGGGDLTEAGVIAELIALFCARGCCRAGADRLCRKMAPGLGACCRRATAGNRRRVGNLSSANGTGDGRPERLDATSRKDRRERHLRYRHSGKTRSGSWRFPDPALNRMDMAGASLTVGRTDRRSDNWRRCVHADRGSGNLGSGSAGRPPCSLVSNCTGARLTTGTAVLSSPDGAIAQMLSAAVTRAGRARPSHDRRGCPQHRSFGS